ncbi:sigma-70 family RNA polymerase sigma factor [Anaerotignum propionicum]|uniref:sigma-70 family RNA polymerase sigma factor n=1 Tax=Anaerotignum propionicum TaxID=28446 RepID=UPI00210ABFEB|nr:sigma-70 family RNA polymerase sigma factor [Anaerotignum propionicum]MCQ4936042.1 sigma-70 family RNA polymerase sigma factor [Anaerotignum propionicum]
MAANKRIPNYKKMYPSANDEVIKVLKQGARKAIYQEYDLKCETFIVDEAQENVYFVPSREDSLERLMESGVQFCDEGATVEELAIEEVMIEMLLANLKFLTLEELELINALFYEEKSEREYAERLGVYHNAIHKRKKKIIKKLKYLMTK